MGPRFEQRTQVWVPGLNRGPRCRSQGPRYGSQVGTKDPNVGPRFEQRTQMWVPDLNRGPKLGSQIQTEDLGVGPRFEQSTCFYQAIELNNCTCNEIIFS